MRNTLGLRTYCLTPIRHCSWDTRASCRLRCHMLCRILSGTPTINTIKTTWVLRHNNARTQSYIPLTSPPRLMYPRRRHWLNSPRKGHCWTGWKQCRTRMKFFFWLLPLHRQLLPLHRLLPSFSFPLLWISVSRLTQNLKMIVCCRFFAKFGGGWKSQLLGASSALLLFLRRVNVLKN